MFPALHVVWTLQPQLDDKVEFDFHFGDMCDNLTSKFTILSQESIGKAIVTSDMPVSCYDAK